VEHIYPGSLGKINEHFLDSVCRTVHTVRLYIDHSKRGDNSQNGQLRISPAVVVVDSWSALFFSITGFWFIIKTMEEKVPFAVNLVWLVYISGESTHRAFRREVR
jgi:hypothetical protein